MNGICGSASPFAFHGQGSRPFVTGALQQHLSQSVERPDLISACVPVCRTFRVLISRVTVSYSQDSRRTLHSQFQRYAGGGSEVLLLVLE